MLRHVTGSGSDSREEEKSDPDPPFEKTGYGYEFLNPGRKKFQKKNTYLDPDPSVAINLNQDLKLS